MQNSDLRETDRLLELHRQAVEIGLASGSESGRLTFLALAERARSRGKRAGALFYWLLGERKTAFITLHDEDEAARRLREHLNGPRGKRGKANDREQSNSGGAVRSSPGPEYTPDQVFVLACIRVANQHRGLEPSTVARAKGWGSERFEAVKAEIEQVDLQRWRNTLGDDEG